MVNIPKETRAIVDDEFDDRLFLATVNSVSSPTARITRVGSRYPINADIRMGKAYRASAAPGDLVLVVVVQGGYLIVDAM